MHKYLAVVFLLAVSCVPQRKSPPPPRTDPDPNCKSACEARERLKEKCPDIDKKVDLDECVLRCEDAERARPGVTGASCAMQAKTCDGLKLCKK